VHLVSKGPHIAQSRLFRAEDGLIRDVEVKQALLSQVSALQSLALLLEHFRHEAHQLLCLVLVAVEKVGKASDALLLIAHLSAHLPQILLPLLRETAGSLIDFHLINLSLNLIDN